VRERQVNEIKFGATNVNSGGSGADVTWNLPLGLCSVALLHDFCVVSCFSSYSY
jgi:hypothetical protein